MCEGTDSGFSDDFVGKRMIIDGIEVPPKNQKAVMTALAADKGLPPFQTDEEIKEYLPGER